MSNIDLFIKDKVENVESEQTRNVYERFYKQVEQNMPASKIFAEYTTEDFVYIFRQMSIATMQTFTSVKSKIKDYVIWLVEHGEMTEEQLRDLSSIEFDDIDPTILYQKHYFKNFDELYITLEEAISDRIDDDDDGGEFDTLRCILYLSWYGFTSEEMRELLKKDIDYNNSTILKRRTGELIKVNNKVLNFLDKYAYSDKFTSRRYGREDNCEVMYKVSSYLLRTDRSAQLTNNGVRLIVSRINENSEKKSFSMKKIYACGEYYRAYVDERDNGEIQSTDYVRLARLFKPELVSQEGKFTSTQRSLLGYKIFTEYKKYKQTFYPEV